MRGPTGIGPWGRNAAWGGGNMPQQGGPGVAANATRISMPSPAQQVSQFMPLANNPAFQNNPQAFAPIAEMLGKYLNNIYGRLEQGGYYDPRSMSDYQPGNIAQMFQQAGGSQAGQMARPLDYQMPNYRGMMSQMGDFSQMARPDLMRLASGFMGGGPQGNYQTPNISQLASMLAGAGTPPAYAAQQQGLSSLLGLVPQTQLTDFMSLPRAQYNYG